MQVRSNGALRRRMLAVAALLCAVLGLSACAGDDGSPGPTQVAGPSIQQIVNAVRKPGKVFYAEMTTPQTGEGPQDDYQTRQWYSMDDAATRSESIEARGGSDLPGSGAKSIYNDDSASSYDPLTSSSTSYPPDPRPQGAPDGGIMGLDYLNFFLSGNPLHYAGKETYDGEAVFRFRGAHVMTKAQADLSEEGPPAGTTFHYAILLRARDLLPVELDQSVDLPPLPTPSPPATADTRGIPSRKVEYTKVGFVDRPSLPADFFDPDTLSATGLTPQDALAKVAKEPFATFWLGPSIDQVWQQPDGKTSDLPIVIDVAGPDLPGLPPPHGMDVSISYGPSKPVRTTLVTVNEASASSFQPIPSTEFYAMKAAGHITALDSDSGYIYARYIPAENCTFEQAQRSPDCRLATVATWGAVVERDGTRIQIVEAPKLDVGQGKDSNPFSSEAAMRDLLSRLQPISQSGTNH